jgi:outer membrane lipoprotein LolB
LKYSGFYAWTAQRWLASPVLTLALLLIAGCSSQPPLPPAERDRQASYQKRLETLATLDHWSLRARLAIDDGEDGGSGSLSWSRNGENQVMNFHGALGRGAWKLVADRAGAELTRADGSVYRAASVDELVRDQLGYGLPVAELAWWIRGLSAPGTAEKLDLNDLGVPQQIVQYSWDIRFDRYREFHGVLMPIKITAREADWTVKLAVRSWQWSGKP